MEVCNVQEKLDTFELIYCEDLMQHWYTIDMKDMFNTLIEILNKVTFFNGYLGILDAYLVFCCFFLGRHDQRLDLMAEA